MKSAIGRLSHQRFGFKVRVELQHVCSSICCLQCFSFISTNCECNQVCNFSSSLCFDAYRVSRILFNLLDPFFSSFNEVRNGLQLTKVATAVTIVSLGDITCQKLEKKSASAPIDFRRTTRMAAWTALITPVIHRWYNLLLATFPTSPLARMAADQVIFAPTSLVGFLCAISFMEHGAGADGLAAAKAKLHSFVPIMKANYLCWPLIMFLNFKLVPPQLNLPVVNAASFFWSIYLSFAANKKGHTHLVDEMLESGPPYGPGRELPAPAAASPSSPSAAAAAAAAFGGRFSPKPVLAEGGRQADRQAEQGLEMSRLRHAQAHRQQEQRYLRGGADAAAAAGFSGAVSATPAPAAATGTRVSDTEASLRARGPGAGSAAAGQVSTASAAAEHLPEDPADPELGDGARRSGGTAAS